MMDIMNFFSHVCIFILFLFMLLKVIDKSKTQKSNSKLPPGPWKLPFLGHLHHMGGLPHHTLRDLAKKHGPLMLLQLGEVPTLIVSSPRVAKEVLKVHDTVFADRPALLAAKTGTYNFTDIIFSPFGKYWRQLRKICFQELFSVKKVQLMWSIRDEEVSNLIEKIYSMAGSPLNMSEMVNSVSNDIISRAAFGKKCKDKEAFLSLMHESMSLAGGFDLADLYPSKKFLHGIIEDVVDVILRLNEDNELAIPMENDNIKAVIQNIFIAGSDTSSTAIIWGLSELMRNPRVMEKAQTEIRKVFDGKETINQSDINELKYLNLVVRETLRLHPPTGIIPPRECRETCEIDGYEIPKGTRLIVNAWAMGRDPEYWSNPERFEPERFQDVSIDYKGTDFEYIPFGAGRRMCPGLLLGVANVELLLAKLLYHFDWKLTDGLAPEELDMTEVFGGVVVRKVDLKLIPAIYRPLAAQT
ncbi:Cytochrome p450 [Thalictrum thalictroides]|uniref:Cytochrome p450 n=1 Tax=Thalictrum thalictroides TaxID=46969 RepID=A0A7J6WHW5_THATH|nr:Cytochrome p450 [Thalictrum thalictroides]